MERYTQYVNVPTLLLGAFAFQVMQVVISTVLYGA